ncbi:hypothetical protein OJAV_G00224890 [Oryzias javanicus]|uniref:PHD-type domain-containing protein n=1 Tax=Oryzias javanicus TaxID=123683 RepID=A0A3S2LZ42_ORYJA|nr:hypothetical protein OJAV_G00224890 [Oryzias javanicus]
MLDSEDFCWKDDVEHEETCAVCREDGELQPCHNCPRVFHPTCLHPPLLTPPRGPWYCPKCQKKVLNKENAAWPHSFVQSYVTHKTVRQEEKRRLLRRNGELKRECAHLQEEDQKVHDTLKLSMDQRERLLVLKRDTQTSLDRLRALIRLIQGEQLVQVTMTTTVPAPSRIKTTSSANPAPRRRHASPARWTSRVAWWRRGSLLKRLPPSAVFETPSVLTRSPSVLFYLFLALKYFDRTPASPWKRPTRFHGARRPFLA